MNRPLVLHAEDGPWFMSEFVAALGACDVPTGPGWDGVEPPVWLRTVDDLSYQLLDAISAPIDAIGCSIGAWLLLEAATKSPASFRRLVLVSPVGVKLNGRDEAQFADLFAVTPEDRAKLLYTEPTRDPYFTDDTTAFTRLATAQQAFARFAWEPYLFSRTLRHRLHRITCPTLIVHGDDDKLVGSPDYYAALATLFGGPTTVTTIADAGHRVEEEQPTALASAVRAFIED